MFSFSACPVDTYMDMIEAPGICKPCPEYTHTLTNATTNRRQCVCIKGYVGSPGGPCTG